MGLVDYVDTKLDAMTAAGVTTKGISGGLAGYNDRNIEDAKMLILDCAGRNAPARVWGSTLTAMQGGIAELRSKERLVDDIIIKISDLVIYVLDEVLNKDQRAIIHIIEEIFDGQSFGELVIIHNMNRLNCDNTEEVAQVTKEMVQEAFHQDRNIRGEAPHDDDIPPSDDTFKRHGGGSAARAVAVHAVSNVETNGSATGFARAQAVDQLDDTLETEPNGSGSDNTAALANDLSPPAIDIVGNDSEFRRGLSKFFVACDYSLSRITFNKN